ncbi:MAG: carboxypeptidase-like regulatory domain-containing protein [Planctomycetota bacterium]
MSRLHLHSLEEGQGSSTRTFEVLIGPTYRIDVTLPPGTEERDFFATFAVRTDTGSRAFRAGFDQDSPFPLPQLFEPGLSDALEPRAPLRHGTPHWVRFPLPVGAWGDSDALDLEQLNLRSSDGLWVGISPIASLCGIYPETLRIELLPRGAIVGRIRWPEGAEYRSARIELDDHGQLVGEQDPDEQGRFAFPWLTPGEHEVRVTAERYREWSTTVIVVAGRTETVDVELKPVAPLGSITGALRSQTGRHRNGMYAIRLTSKDDPTFCLVQVVTYRKREEEFEAPFTFDEVPAGMYELTLEPEDNLRWNTLSQTVRAPAEGLEFRCDDTVPTFDLGFRILDQRTGEPILRAWTLAWLGETGAERRLNPDSRHYYLPDWRSDVYSKIPEGVPIRWMVRAAGYRLAWGDETNLTSEGDTRVAEVRLVPGWGQIFVVTTKDRVPLAGVELSVDGEFVGLTDTSGSIRIERGSKPTRLEFRLEGWHVSWGGVDPSRADFGWEPETPVHLERDD